MKRLDDRNPSKPSPVRGKTSVLDLESLAVQALTFLAADEERLGTFLAVTGVDPAQLRDLVSQVGFTRGILNYVAANEELLLRFCSDVGLDPETVGRSVMRFSSWDSSP